MVVVASVVVGVRSTTVSGIRVLLEALAGSAVDVDVTRLEEDALCVDVTVLGADELITCIDEVVPPVRGAIRLTDPLGGTAEVATLFCSDSEVGVTIVGVASSVSVDSERVLFESPVVPTCLLTFSPKL